MNEKILHLINYAGNGGSEKYIQTIGGDFLVYNIKGPPTNYFDSFQTFQIKMKSAFDFRAAKKLSKFCKKNDVKVVHTHFLREHYIAIFSKFFGNKAKVIYTSHINVEHGFIKRIINLIVTRRSYAIIAVCNSVKELLIKNGYPNKIKVIYNGVPRRDLEEDVTVNTKNIVTLARLSEEKGLFFLCNVAKKMDNFNFIVAGDGPLKEKLLNYAPKNVSFVGHVNPEEILKNAVLYFNSSSSEALSFGILEAMSYKVPLVLTNTGGNVDIINESGAGILFNYGDVTMCIEAINKVFRNREMYGEKALEAIENVFSEEVMKKKTYEAYGIGAL